MRNISATPTSYYRERTTQRFRAGLAAASRLTGAKLQWSFTAPTVSSTTAVVMQDSSVASECIDSDTTGVLGYKPLGVVAENPAVIGTNVP